MPIRHAKISPKPNGADTTLVQPSDWNAGHLLQWRVVAAGETLADSDPVLALVATQSTFPLPDVTVAGANFAIKNSSASTGDVWVIPNSDGLLALSPTITLAPGAKLVVRPGESAQIVARTGFDFELVARDAIPAVATVSVNPAVNFEATRVVVDAGINPGARVQAWLIPNADWDADELADYRVTATPGTGSVEFLISAPGPIGGTFDIAYTWR